MSNTEKFLYKLPFEEGFMHSSLPSPRVKILILAAQIVQSFQHEGRQDNLPFLGEAPRKYFCQGHFLLMYMISLSLLVSGLLPDCSFNLNFRGTF